MDGLHGRIEHALKLVEWDPRGHLPRPERIVLLRALGPYVSGHGQTPMTSGHRARTRLACACVWAVLPAWAQLFPADDWPDRALAAAEGRLRGELDAPAAVRVRHALWRHAEEVEAELWDRTHDTSDLRVVVCRAAHAALCVAIHDEWLGGEEGFPVDADDDRLDTCDLETAYLASAVAANGLLGQSKADVQRRRQFWDRYLTEFLPGAALAEAAAVPDRRGTQAF
jgi:hypothetical protein